jgi:glycyl-tRNA synthetase
MKSLYNINGLVFWEEEDLRIRKFIEETLKEDVKNILLKENLAWKFYQIEAPSLIPKQIINQNYTPEDIWLQNPDTLVLKPETTPSSYVYAQHLLNSNQSLPPLVIWQTSKSFRREQDQVLKNMRLKEFYQQEFQCIYTAETLNDYQTKVLEPLRQTLENLLAMPTRIVDSDRLPSYSLKTIDIEVFNEDKWMEICSISKRTDFPQKVNFNVKGKSIEKDLLVLEIALGLDRIVYNYLLRTKKM